MVIENETQPWVHDPSFSSAFQFLFVFWVQNCKWLGPLIWKGISVSSSNTSMANNWPLYANYFCVRKSNKWVHHWFISDLKYLSELFKKIVLYKYIKFITFIYTIQVTTALLLWIGQLINLKNKSIIVLGIVRHYPIEECDWLGYLRSNLFKWDVITLLIVDMAYCQDRLH